MKRFKEFTQNIIKSDYGMSVKDIMETDWRDLMAIISDDQETDTEDVMALGDFVRQMQGT